ncbi:MAG: phosphotransferase system, HPr-related protein [Sedimentibacter sp.]|nr:phosphotransferase system, HPr-related protein [Sedimentibacter sp.]
MRSQKVILKNKIGLHARPAAIFVKKARNFDSEIIIKKGIQEANGKSIISIMALNCQTYWNSWKKKNKVKREGENPLIYCVCPNPNEFQIFASYGRIYL